MISGQTSSVVVSIPMIYLKYFIVSSVCPYSLKSIYYPACTSSSSSCRNLYSSPRTKIAVLGWWLLSAAQVTHVTGISSGVGMVTFLKNNYRVPHMVVHEVNL